MKFCEFLDKSSTLAKLKDAKMVLSKYYPEMDLTDLDLAIDTLYYELGDRA